VPHRLAAMAAASGSAAFFPQAARGMYRFRKSS